MSSDDWLTPDASKYKAKMRTNDANVEAVEKALKTPADHWWALALKTALEKAKQQRDNDVQTCNAPTMQCTFQRCTIIPHTMDLVAVRLRLSKFFRFQANANDAYVKAAKEEADPATQTHLRTSSVYTPRKVEIVEFYTVHSTIQKCYNAT